MKLFNIRGVLIRINPLLLVLTAAWIITGYWTTAAVIYVLLILHELGHAMAAAAFGVRIYELELLPFGACVRMENVFEGHPLKESIIAAAGPVTSLMCAVSACALSGYFPGFITEQLKLAERFGLITAVFNLLPVLPLDGGRILRALISRKCDFGRATRIVSAMGMTAGAGLFVWGVYEIFNATANPMLPLLGVFLFFSALEQYRLGRFELAKYLLDRERTHNKSDTLYVKEVAIRDSMPLSGALRLLNDPDRYYVFRVLDDDMRIRGSFDEQQLKSCISDAGCADSTAGELVRTQSNEGCNAGKAKAFAAVKEDCC